MKTLKQIIFMFAVVVGLTFSVSAQKDDQKRPPKDPPKIEPGPKGQPPRNPPPKDPKKPGMAFYIASSVYHEDDLA